MDLIKLPAQTNDWVTAKRDQELGIRYCKESNWDAAINKLSSVIAIMPDDSAAFDWRGCAYFAKGELDKAINDFSQGIRLNPTNANAFLNRGNAYGAKLDFKRAISDLTESLRLNPNQAIALASRGQYYARTSEFEKALSDYNEALRYDPKSNLAYNGLGWLRATCPVVAIRNGMQAVEAATRACELTNWDRWQCVSTLAAAFAQAGDFDKAMSFQAKALNMTGASDKDRKEMQSRLDLYKQRKPFREESKR